MTKERQPIGKLTLPEFLISINVVSFHLAILCLSVWFKIQNSKFKIQDRMQSRHKIS